MTIKPNRFVGLHAHTGFSVFDGLGYPADHIDFVLENGMDAWALTDHGNGSGLAHARKHTEKLQKSGRKYRQLYGCEFYFVPSLINWRDDYEAHRQAVRDARSEAKAKEVTDIDADDDVVGSGHTIEDEDETKTIDTTKDEWKRRYHLVVIAKNQVGMGNLFTLIKKAYKHGFYRFPRIDFNMLAEHGEGLVVSTACLGGIYSNRVLRGEAMNKSPAEIQSELQNLTDRFTHCVGRDNFFLELQFNRLDAQHSVNNHLLQLHESTGVPLIATADSHYYNPDKWEARELYKRLGWMRDNPSPLPEFDNLKCELYPKNASQMWDEYLVHRDKYDFYKGKDQAVCDAINRTHDIAWDLCEDVWIDRSVKLPNFNKPNKSAFDQLLDLVKKGLVETGLHNDPVYVERTKTEMSDIKYLGFENYFLTMYQVFHKASDRTLFGPARGSGGGSLVNYLLGITQLDPIPYGLLWDRFLGRHRTSWPDIDSDAGDRDALIDAARELYGDEAVIPVSNFNTLKLKSLIKDISKFYGVDFGEVNKVTGPLQDEVMAQARDDNTEKSVFVLKHEDCMKYSKKYRDFMTEYPKVKDHIEALFMQNRSIGRHAGGVIIAPAEELEKTMPLVSVRGEFQTPWTEGMNFRNLEDNGFIKFDFLGLTLLKDVENCIRRILKSEGHESPTFLDIKAYFDKNLNCRFNNQDDTKVWEHVYHQRRKTGVFQFTAEGARKFCEDAKPRSIEELAALTAIYRPGPLRANVHKKYVRDKTKSDKIVYDHPIIEEILGVTFGHITFQEQFMLLAQKLAGFSPGESDKMRKTLVKKSLDTIGKKGAERDALRKQFVEGARDLHGLNEDSMHKLFDRIEYFSVYGFNKSHAVAYAIDSYYAAWLHTYHEKAWLATILQSENSSPKNLQKAISEIKQMGYRFAAADINFSGDEWVYNEDREAFVPPLTSVKGVGVNAVQEIMLKRPYTSLHNLLYDEEGKWKHSKMNKTCFSSLCKISAFSSLEDVADNTISNHRQLYEIIIENYEVLRKSMYGMTMRKAMKTCAPPILPELIRNTEYVDDWTRSEKLVMHYDLTSTVPRELLYPGNILDKIENADIPRLSSLSGKTRAVAWFCIQEIIKKKTKNGKTFYRLRVCDDQNNLSWLRVWGFLPEEATPFTIWLADVKNDPNWGASTSGSNMKPLVV